MMAYYTLREKSGYLKDIETEGKAKSVRADEITRCEEYADGYIEGRLGKSWASSSVPYIIEEVAELLGSSKAWRILHTGQSPEKSAYADELKTQADDLLKQIISGEIGLKLPDGSWDEDYPGGQNTEGDTAPDIEIII